MRIDRFLFCVRLIKSRTQAQELLAQGRTRIDGKRVEKPSEEVKVGSIVALPLRGQVRIVRVLALPDRRGPPAEARTCYEDVDERPPTSPVDGTPAPQ
ncbi:MULTISPECIES: RNA-binding S4 domain-containing protein [Sphingomonas]|uniref:RNA-binding S4 domain-containing protein n=1 Tax=Sphingomonas TaxID=13687 RepID=UPI000DEECF01|nr:MULTISPECIES: RNA-binding S4 domain-containing protein [Sphingomonas]